MTTTIELEGDEELDPYELVVVASTFSELLPFLRLADRAGVPVTMTPTTNDDTQFARELRFELQSLTGPKGLATFLLAATAISEDLGSDGMIHTVANNAKALRDEALNDLHGSR